MDTTAHTFETLFQQLGLPGDSDSIDKFIATHTPLAAGLPLAEAPFWSSGQAAFIREALIADSDWAEVVDQLNACLRA